MKDVPGVQVEERRDDVDACSRVSPVLHEGKVHLPKVPAIPAKIGANAPLKKTVKADWPAAAASLSSDERGCTDEPCVSSISQYALGRRAHAEPKWGGRVSFRMATTLRNAYALTVSSTVLKIR